jgi:hypothetical protein
MLTEAHDAGEVTNNRERSQVENVAEKNKTHRRDGLEVSLRKSDIQLKPEVKCKIWP